MQLRYVFSELGQGLRRNLSMHVAVILTLFVSLTLVGLTSADFPLTPASLGVSALLVTVAIDRYALLES